MPNWCGNHIEIDGPVDKVSAIWSLANDDTDTGLLEALCPIGKWDYHNALAEWGTKWDINMTDANLEFTEYNDGNAIISGYIESAWSPPVAAVDSYVQKNPDVSIRLAFYEPANDFAGTYGYADCEDTDISVWDQELEFWEKDDAGIVLNEIFNIYDDVFEHHEEINQDNLDNDSLVDPEKVP